LDWSALLLSLKLASLTTGFLFLVGLPLAYALSRRQGWIATFLEALISLPLVLPPTVLGFYLLLALSQVHLAFSFTGLLLASVVYSFPFALQPFLASFQAVDQNLVEASWVLGESRLSTFFRIIVPLAKSGILSGAVLAFAHTLGEFGVVLMIGGNIPGVSRTLSISIYDHVESLNYQAANRTAGFLLVVSLAALLVTSFVRKKAPVTV
jgi:molybdate transport system permease protein